MSERALESWQATYDWACSNPDTTLMDGAWWWQACLMHISAKAFRGTKGIVSKPDVEVTAPSPDNQWVSALLDELYGVLFPEYRLTIGQFKAALEKVKP